MHCDMQVCQRLCARAGLRPLPFRTSQRLTSVRVHAKASPIPVPVWPKDTETTRDLFAFAGSAPEVGACLLDSCLGSAHAYLQRELKPPHTCLHALLLNPNDEFNLCLRNGN